MQEPGSSQRRAQARDAVGSRSTFPFMACLHPHPASMFCWDFTLVNAVRLQTGLDLFLGMWQTVSAVLSLLFPISFRPAKNEYDLLSDDGRTALTGLCGVVFFLLGLTGVRLLHLAPICASDARVYYMLSALRWCLALMFYGLEALVWIWRQPGKGVVYLGYCATVLAAGLYLLFFIWSFAKACERHEGLSSFPIPQAPAGIAGSPHTPGWPTHPSGATPLQPNAAPMSAPTSAAPSARHNLTDWLEMTPQIPQDGGRQPNALHPQEKKKHVGPLPVPLEGRQARYATSPPPGSGAAVSPHPDVLPSHHHKGMDWEIEKAEKNPPGRSTSRGKGRLEEEEEEEEDDRPPRRSSSGSRQETSHEKWGHGEKKVDRKGSGASHRRDEKETLRPEPLDGVIRDGKCTEKQNEDEEEDAPLVTPPVFPPPVADFPSLSPSAADEKQEGPGEAKSEHSKPSFSRPGGFLGGVRTPGTKKAGRSKTRGAAYGEIRNESSGDSDGSDDDLEAQQGEKSGRQFQGIPLDGSESDDAAAEGAI
uniref:Uncharacterized protein n=1 Tax=Chromera velia CCMP2878 TaxID=1169474 RepID=A0A0G4HIK2_9ALVE|mmetsp:Transcript_33623/g.66607  ORF Transcript_33623/g.66607 Transcript_33623/m.66607 type:complete len:534 (+) Transcript_33623:196-1797(+)|eukprot:Cvel_27826.t1-p1 / transcript=Cvel_27826.t1 / gene=Cvel_27826 / organism=Chromera_velia_CCMP2878 / gene_product=hypothetical protein / transcript_product=hypothetical protein / location=Cvel_scaffold3536:1701-4897(+) / protein_length=533 / sequence_SO=supercontig / SO=protein_coding / is_pseudo=false